MSENGSNNKKGGMGPVRWIILIAAICVFCYSGYQLFTILWGYKAANDEYSSLAEEFTNPVSAGAGSDKEKEAASASPGNAEAVADVSLAGNGAGTAAADATNSGTGEASGEASGRTEGTAEGEASGEGSGQTESAAGGASTSALTGTSAPNGTDDAANANESVAGNVLEIDAGEADSTGANAAAAASGSAAPTGKSGAAESAESKAELVIPKIPAEEKEEEHYLIEDAKPPLEVNFKELQAINPEIVGWVYVDAQDNISYPILRAEDNEAYLHQTFRKQYLYAGSIFEDCHNKGDFADPNTVVYGHNMRDGSMFGTLKNMNDQEKYDKDPYFWILTPDGNYRYHIFSIFTTGAESDTYNLYFHNGPEFLEWEKKMQSQSNVKNDVPLSKSDKTVILSTCTSDSSMRCVVIGKCVSSDRPKRKQATALTTVSAAGGTESKAEGDSAKQSEGD